MATKVFISYSHKDEEFREALEEHLAMLSNKGIISAWHDRKITPGNEWEGEISHHLESAKLILFLVSSSFLASPYCRDVEVKRAIERYKKKQVNIISIIIRPCDWGGCSLSKLQVLPKDALAVTEWENQDRAWLNVIQGIKLHLEDFHLENNGSEENSLDEAQQEFIFSENVSNWLNDTEIVLSHRRVSEVYLKDIYVVPDLEFENEAASETVDIRSSSDIVNLPGHYIISGEEQQGKTSLLKYYFGEFLKKGHLPVYIDAKSVNQSDLDVSLKKAISEQYSNLSYEKFTAYTKPVILIDNIDEICLNKKFRSIFLNSVIERFDYTVLTCHSSFSYVFGDIPAIDRHQRSEFLNLGNKKREELIKKWISLGVEESITEEELYPECDDIKIRLNTIIKKNIVPPKPIYVLMLLQMFENNLQLNLEMTSYGHCYQQLIYQSFDKARIDKVDFDKYLNVLTELSWWIFKHECNPNKNQLIEFFKDYCEVYLPVNQSSVMKKLITHSILICKDFKTWFKYPYIYYFFVGKKIAESYADSEEVRVQVNKLLSNLHREDFANILIFITHHTKDSWVLRQINKVLNSLFEGQKIASLDKVQLSFMENFMKKIPDLIIEQRSIQQARDAHNQQLDDMERMNNNQVEGAPDLLANINKAFKGTEIAGQIIKNRHATLKRDTLLDIAECGVATGLRFLDFFISTSDATKKEVLKMISAHLIDHPDLTDRKIKKYAEDAYMQMTYGVISGVIRKIASSIGSREALEIYNLLEKKSKNPALLLIKQSVELQFSQQLKLDNVLACANELWNNPVCTRILKEMIIQHIYMFPVDYKEKQQLSSKLGISVKGQRQMDLQRIGKG